MTYENMLDIAMKMNETKHGSEDTLSVDAQIIAFLLDNCEIIIQKNSEFFVRVNIGEHGNRIMRKIVSHRLKRIDKTWITPYIKNCQKSYVFNGSVDFGHTNPPWSDIMKLGFSGLKQRIESIQIKNQKEKDFVDAELLVFNAAERFMNRAADKADESGKQKMAIGIRNLIQRAPANLFECYQMTLLYYCLQQFFDATDVRTLGRLDSLTLPFYLLEPNKMEVERMTESYMREIDAIEATANMPFALGGSDETGQTIINEMSYILLDTYDKTKLPNTKLHILYTNDMPQDFILKCVNCIKHGGNSLVFINDKIMINGLVKLGIDPVDSQGYGIVGCYESSAIGEIPCSCAAKLSLQKALEATLYAGKDKISGLTIGLEQNPDCETFDEFYQMFLNNLRLMIENTITLTNGFESIYPIVHASPFMSASLEHCVQKCGDAYVDYAAKYNNTSINLIGLATVTDSLYAIKKLVFDDQLVTLEKFTQMLSGNWDGYEHSRLWIRNKLPKYGSNNQEVDEIARNIFEFASKNINGVPNAKGGVYRMGIFSIDWRKDFGVYTAASADGRVDGETLSQNASCTFGCDKEGPTQHMMTVAGLNGEDAVNGLVLDIDLHSSFVNGDSGTKVFASMLSTFMASGGQTVHFNVLNEEMLRDAQIHPENYQNLQVRVCGWNALFINMSKDSQDEFIRRTEMLNR